MTPRQESRAVTEPFLRDKLADWTYWDGAAYWLGCALGIFPPDPNQDDCLRFKGVFWSNNPLGNALHNTLEELVRGGVLEKRDEPDVQYRWNLGFRVG